VVNRRKAPWIATTIVSIVAIALVWWKPLEKIVWYYDVVTITLVASYISALAAMLVAVWKLHRALIAALLSAPVMLAIAVLAYIGYTSGANPVSPEDLYNAWYLGAATLLTGVLIVVARRRTRVSRRAQSTNVEAS
jgi:hypothetical protein